MTLFTSFTSCGEKGFFEMTTCLKGKMANEPMNFIPTPAALLSCRLLIPLCGQESRHKQASKDRSLGTLGIRSCLPRVSCYFHTMTLTELPQVQALSARAKLELVDEIWRSLSTSPDYLEVTQEEKDILDSRWEGFLSNSNSALSIDMFKSKINAIRA